MTCLKHNIGHTKPFLCFSLILGGNGRREVCVVPEGSVPRWRAPLRPSHCLARPQSERPANGPLPLICRGRLYPSGTTQTSRLPSSLSIHPSRIPTRHARPRPVMPGPDRASPLNSQDQNRQIWSWPVHFVSGEDRNPGFWSSPISSARVESPFQGLRCLVTIYTMAGAARTRPPSPAASRPSVR